jgi:hypothetical protein
MSDNDRRPTTEIGDVVIHHASPRTWIPAAIIRAGDLDGRRSRVQSSRAAALEIARELLLPRGRIYIRHHDDAIWETVEGN